MIASLKEDTAGRRASANASDASLICGDHFTGVFFFFFSLARALLTLLAFAAGTGSALSRSSSVKINDFLLAHNVAVLSQDPK